MSNDRVDYFLSSLEYYIRQGKSPEKALKETVSDYAYEFDIIKKTRQRRIPSISALIDRLFSGRALRAASMPA